MSNRVCTIYGLSSSFDWKIRYVGQTCVSVRRRLLKHNENARLGIKSHLYNWMREQILKGHEILSFVIETDAVYSESEKRWIKWYKKNGVNLVNQTDGGDGTLGWKHTSESRSKFLSKRIGSKQNLSLEEIEKRKKRILEIIKKPEVRKKISQSLSGRKLTKESIKKRTATRISRGNYKQSDSHRKLRSELMKKIWLERKKGESRVACY